MLTSFGPSGDTTSIERVRAFSRISFSVYHGFYMNKRPGSPEFLANPSHGLTPVLVSIRYGNHNALKPEPGSISHFKLQAVCHTCREGICPRYINEFVA
jgi:hypothetical protein